VGSWPVPCRNYGRARPCHLSHSFLPLPPLPLLVPSAHSHDPVLPLSLIPALPQLWPRNLQESLKGHKGVSNGRPGLPPRLVLPIKEQQRLLSSGLKEGRLKRGRGGKPGGGEGGLEGGEDVSHFHEFVVGGLDDAVLLHAASDPALEGGREGGHVAMTRMRQESRRYRCPCCCCFFVVVVLRLLLARLGRIVNASSFSPSSSSPLSSSSCFVSSCAGTNRVSAASLPSSSSSTPIHFNNILLLIIFTRSWDPFPPSLFSNTFLNTRQAPASRSKKRRNASLVVRRAGTEGRREGAAAGGPGLERAS